MKNATKGWITTVLGMIIISLSICDYFGIIKLTAPDGIGEETQVKTAFIIGFILFLIPETALEKSLQKLVDKHTDA